MVCTISGYYILNALICAPIGMFLGIGIGKNIKRGKYMNKSILKTIGKCAIFGVIWAIVLFGVALILTNFKDYELKDVLFVEGIIFVIGGVLSSLGGNPMGLSMQGLGQSNAQYIANSNLKVTKIEKDKNKRL